MNKEYIITKKSQLKNNDIITFKNKKGIVLSQINRYIINEFYNDNLEHISDPEYNVEEVKRPQYVKVYQRNKWKDFYYIYLDGNVVVLY